MDAEWADDERDEPPYHVFLCYKWEDGGAVRNLRRALRARGLRVFLDAIDGEDWAPLSASVREALMRSRSLVALITPRFPYSSHCRDEIHLALHASYRLDGGRTPRVMAVAQGVELDDVEPYRLTSFRLPRTGIPDDELISSIVCQVREHEGLFGDVPEPSEPVWHPRKPARNRIFHGRNAELWRLHHALRALERNNDRGQPVAIVHGQGGIGKTALCLQYARLFQRDHPGGVFVLSLGGSGSPHGLSDAAVAVAYAEQRAEIAERLGADGPDGLATALDSLGGDYLWIVDDVPSTAGADLLRSLAAPTGRGRTLITKRGPAVVEASGSFELSPLDTGTGVSVLTSLNPKWSAERGEAAAVVRLLGGLPLGLTLAAGLTTLPGFGGYGELLADLSSVAPDRLELAAHLETQVPVGCAHPFAAALLRAFDRLSPAAQAALCAASVLAPVDIPAELLTRMTSRALNATEPQAAAGLDEVVRRGLMETTEPGGFFLHALVARAVRVLARTEATRNRARSVALSELTELVEATRVAPTHRAILRHLPHVRAVAGLMPAGDPWELGEDERHLALEGGRAQIEAGLTGEALDGLRLLWDACSALPGLDAYTRYTVQTALGAAYGLQGHLTTALCLKEEASAGLARELGPTHRDALTALNNLAVTFLELKEYRRAHELLRTVYQGRRRIGGPGPTHRETLRALNNVAVATGHLGMNPAERHFYRRVAHRYWLAANAQWKRVALPGDPDALDALNGLVLSFRALGMRREALLLAEELHQRRVTVLGAEHPDALGALENRLILLAELGKAPRGAFRPILLGRLRGEGPAHPRTRDTVWNLILTEGGAGHDDGERDDRTMPFAVRARPSVASALPERASVRLEGDHVDREVMLQGLAVDHQQRQLDLFGPDDPRTMMATLCLAYALALADHLDGQVEDALVLADDSFAGLADAADAGAGKVSRDDAEIARLVSEWIADLVLSEGLLIARQPREVRPDHRGLR